MKKILFAVKNIIIKNYKKITTVFIVITTITGFITGFNLIPDNYLILSFIIAIVSWIIISIIWIIISSIYTANKTTDTSIKDRIGSFKSMSPDLDVFADKTHKYIYIKRQDLLDYSQMNPNGGRDFVSIREIKIKNVSKFSSSSITYVECTEYKIYSSLINVQAYDIATGKRLKVEFIDCHPEKKYNTFPIKIHFQRPLLPQETYEIVFCINLKNELEVLNEDNEFMSICLHRCIKGVEHLEFNVCLNFEPKAVTIEYSKDKNEQNMRFKIVKDKPTISKYIPRTKYENQFNINWFSEPYKINWSCNNPNGKIYIIKYRK